jgi:hypothetical protein
MHGQESERAERCRTITITARHARTADGGEMRKLIHVSDDTNYHDAIVTVTIDYVAEGRQENVEKLEKF